eukprot:s734_g21.t1
MVQLCVDVCACHNAGNANCELRTECPFQAVEQTKTRQYRHRQNIFSLPASTCHFLHEVLEEPQDMPKEMCLVFDIRVHGNGSA